MDETQSVLEQLYALLVPWDGTIERRYCNLANATALLASYLPSLNWLGFYLVPEGGKELVLGPFQGKVACTDIPFSRGVCGLAARENRTVNVEDVHAIADHIACDGESNSEIVVPLCDSTGAVVGVLDVDSPLFGRFSGEDQAFLEAAASLLSKSLWT